MRKRKVGRHRKPENYKRGYDVELGTRFEAKMKQRLRNRKNEKAGRRANRRGRSGGR